jgi:hypothetical protein
MPTVTVATDGSRNQAAEKHIMAVLPRAVAMDKRRLVSQQPDMSNPKAVDVLDDSGTSIAYTLSEPASNFACCSCLMAKQRKACKHHVAWLLSQAPDSNKEEAMRLIVCMLGTRLGFSGGCSMEDIKDLFDALLALHCRLTSLFP